MSASSFRLNTVVLSAALSIVLSAPVRNQEKAPLKPGVTPGSLALLANKFDAEAIKAMGLAITDHDPVVRAVAARIVGVVAYPPFGNAIAQALEQEQDSKAAVEQVRALLLLRGDLAIPTIERRISSFRELVEVYAEWMVKVQPQRLADALPRLSTLLGDKRSELNDHVRAAFTKLPESRERLLRVWLEASSGASWWAFLERLAFDGSQEQTAVLIDALKSSDGSIREATVWNFVTSLAKSRRVTAVLLDAAVQEAGRTNVATDGAPVSWEQFGRELIARKHAGQKTPDRSVVIATDAMKHPEQALALASFDQLSRSESKALEAALGDKFPKPGSSITAPTAQRGSDSTGAMRTVPLFWPGFLRNVLDVAGCRIEKTTRSGTVLVGYDDVGRVNSISVGTTKLPDGCDNAVIALARLSFADPASPPAAGAKEWLVLPLDEEYVMCADSSELSSDDGPVPIGPARGIQPPKKTRDVKPTYPEVLLQKRVEGVVILEGVISKSGCIHSLRVMRSAEPRFDYAALHAVSGWRFTPTLLVGRPVNVLMTITVNFTLR